MFLSHIALKSKDMELGYNPFKLKMSFVPSIFLWNSKYVILSLRQMKGGIYVFQELFRGEHFDSIVKGPTILGRRSLSLGDLSSNYQCCILCI